MIHIVFEEANIEVLKKAFVVEPALHGDIKVIADDYAVGPITDLYNENGRNARLLWWKEVVDCGPYKGIADDGHVDDNKVVEGIKDAFSANETEIVWIWAGQNKHDVAGYYWLIGQLNKYQGRIFILYLNNLPFINEKGGLFYPTHLFEILPREVVKATKLARPVTPSEFEIDPDEWEKLSLENKGIRLLEGGKKLTQRNYNYYDKDLLQLINSEWLKASKLFQQYYSKVKETTGDAFLIWRLWQLAENGVLETRGNRDNMKEFEVRKIPTPDTE